MSTVRILSPQENLLDTVLTYLPVDRDDYSSFAVLFQGKRPAHFLRKELALRRGRACVPPAMFSLESYIDFCYRELLGMTGNDIASLDAIAILFEEHLAMRDRIGGEGFERLESFFSLGLRLFDALEELRFHNTPTASLRAALPLSDFPSGDRLAAFYDRFYHRLTDEGLVTRATKALCVAERIGDLDLGRFERVLVAGFYSFTPVEEAIIAHLKGSEKSAFLFQDGPGLKRRMEGLGFEEVGETIPLSLPKIHYVRAQGTHGEILGLNRLLTDPDTAPPMDERTVLVLPSSDALFPMTEWTLPLVPEGNVNVSLGYAASRTPAFGFIESLLNLLDSRDGDRFFAPDYIRFILHPYTKNIAFCGRPEPTRIMFHTIEAALASTLGGAFFELGQMEHDTKLHATVALASKDFVPDLTPEEVADHLKAIHDLCIRGPRTAGTFGEFASSMREILTFVDDHSVARTHGLFRRFVAALMEALEAIRESRLASHSDRDGKSYGLLVLHALRQVNVPFPGTPVQGVQVLGLLETRNLQFENVFVLDVNDDVLPGSPDVDPLLPAAVRAVLKLPQSFERQEAIEHYFMVLLAGATNVHLLYREGASVRRSRFIERLIWEDERRTGALATTDPARPLTMDISATNRRPPPLAKSKEDLAVLRSLRYSATSLDVYLRCPLQFYYAYVLHLRERREVDPEINPRGIGTLLHEVMRELDSPASGNRIGGGSARDIDLRSALDKVFTTHFGSEPPLPLELMKSQMEKQLGRYLSWYGKAVASQFPVVLEGLEVMLDGEFQGLRLGGRADRIEWRGDRRVIIDYKKGGEIGRYRVNTELLDPEDPTTWPRALQSIQLPLYLLMTAKEPADLLRIDPVYVFLGSLREDDFEVPLFDDAVDRGRAWEKIIATLSSIFEDILNPGKDFNAPADLGLVCPECPFRGICGTGWVRSRGAQ